MGTNLVDVEQNQIFEDAQAEQFSEASEDTLLFDGGEANDGEADEIFEQTIENEEPAEEVQLPKKIFISYKRDVNDLKVCDQEIAERLYADLTRKNYDVFLDTKQPPGVDFERCAAEFLDQTDYVIVLLSTYYVNESNYGRAELEQINARYKREKRPTIIPIRLAYVGQLGLTLTSYLGRFQTISWINQDYWWLLERVDCALNKQPLPLDKLSAIGLNPFLISKSRRDRIKSTFVEPLGNRFNGNLVNKKNILWVVGSPDVRNYLAVSVAAKQETEAVYEISKSKTWYEIYNSGVTKSTIILRDILPARHLGEDLAGDELSSLASLIEQDNILIATLSEEAFSQARQEMRKYDFNDFDHTIEVSHTSYNRDAKILIFTKLLDFSYQSGEIGLEQYTWARSLIHGAVNEAEDQTQLEANGLPHNQELIENSQAKFQEVIERWSPADIERFVRVSLQQSKRYSDLLKFLQRNALLDDEIQAWFVALDDSVRCFILLLAIFNEFDNESFWLKYKSAVQHLQKLAPHLSSFNLGICRQQAEPYVSTEGSVDFADERVAEAIIQELAKSYREYFVELIPKFKEWSVPADREVEDKAGKAERKRKAEQTKAVRLAIARVIGKFGRLGIDDLLEIIEYWATDPLIQIRDAAAVAIEQIIQDAKAANHALDLLEHWCTTPSGKQINYRMCTAALCLARVISAKPETSIALRAIDCMEGLAKSNKRGVKFHVSVALQRMASEIPLDKIQPLATTIAGKGVEMSLRLNVANALNQSRYLDEAQVTALLEKWSLSENVKLRWTAFCCPVIQRDLNHRKLGRAKDFASNRNRQLFSFLDQDAALLANVFVESISNEHHNKTVFVCLENFILEASDEHLPKLVAAFALLSLEKLEATLFDSLSASGHEKVKHLVIEIRQAAWKRTLLKPPDFLNLLKERLGQKQPLRETFDTLISLLKPEPQGCRNQVIQTFANCYPQQSNVLEAVLSRLNKIAPSHFEPVTQQVWRQVLQNLFSDPPAFLAFIHDNVNREGKQAMTLAIVESLAQSFPNEVLQAFAFNYSLQSPTVKAILHLFRTCQNSRLNRIAQEFYYRLLEGELFDPDPSKFVNRIKASLQDEQERPALLGALQLLYMANPKSRTDEVIDMLAQALDQLPQDTEALFSSPYLKGWSNLESLEHDVRRAHSHKHSLVTRFLNRFFSSDA
jgi:hypothetical protein